MDGKDAADGLPGLKGDAGAPGSTGLQGPKGDPSYQHTIVVSPCTSFVAAGMALRNMVAGQSSACASGTIPAGAPTAASPWLIKLEPGTYDLGLNTLALPDHVDLEGSGSQSTRITANTTAINVSGASDLRFLSANSSGLTAGVVQLLAGSNSTLDSVSINGAVGDTNTGLVVGLNIAGAQSATVRDSQITATSGFSAGTTTIQSVGASPLVTDSTILATSKSTQNTRALRLSAGSPVIQDSRIVVDNGGFQGGYGIIAAAAGTDEPAIAVTVRGTTIAASQAVQANKANTVGAVVNLSNSEIRSWFDDAAPYRSLFASNGGQINVAYSLIRGLAQADGSSTLHCLGAFRPDYITALTASCS